jgi:gluconolactonase
VREGAEPELLDDMLDMPGGIALSPDGSWLTVAEGASRWGYSYRVGADGRVDAKERFYWLHTDDRGGSGACALTVDVEGRLYAATHLGIQLLDRNGRTRAILPVPGGFAVDLAFGGAASDTLHAACADGRIYRRRLGVAGARPWQASAPLPAWSAA